MSLGKSHLVHGTFSCITLEEMKACDFKIKWTLEIILHHVLHLVGFGLFMKAVGVKIQALEVSKAGMSVGF